VRRYFKCPDIDPDFMVWSSLFIHAANGHLFSYQCIDGTAVSVSESLITAKESKELYIRILEEMRERRAAKRRGKEIDICIKEMHCQMREDELKDEEEELRRREEAIKKQEDELKLREDELQRCKRKGKMFFHSTQ
jgi:hypothetical protein